MNPTGILMAEHILFDRALRVLSSIAQRMVDGRSVPRDAVARLLDFFVNFVDGVHQQKEERLLFPALVRAGVIDEDGPIERLRNEHDVVRGHLGDMRAAASELLSSQIARLRFADAARSFRVLLSQHMARDNHVLYMMANRVLDDPEQAELIREFATFEERAAGPEARARYQASIEDLEVRLEAMAEGARL